MSPSRSDAVSKPAQDTTAPGANAAAVGVVAWLIPGAGHLMVGAPTLNAAATPTAVGNKRKSKPSTRTT